jgi:putative transposase
MPSTGLGLECIGLPMLSGGAAGWSSKRIIGGQTMTDDIFKEYAHAPPHLFRHGSIYMITASTRKGEHHLGTRGSRRFVCYTLLHQTEMSGWSIEAWAVMTNHYHCIMRAPETGSDMAALVRSIHSITARYINRADGTPGRRVWSNYWDTCITHERSYLARLHYVHTNAVRHGLALRPEDYPFCSYHWFLRTADPQFRERVLGSPVDKLNIWDDF